MAQCARGAEHKRRRLVEAETRESLEWSFEAYGEPIKNVSTFRYLGRLLMAGYDDWIAMAGNHGKAQKGGPRSCLVEGCPCRAATRKAMQVHLLHRHVLNTVVILEEGTPPQQQCADATRG